MNQVPQASKVSPSLYLADQDPSISPSVSPQGVVKWKDLDQEVQDWVVSLMPPKIKQTNGTIYAKSRRNTVSAFVTYYKCICSKLGCRANYVGTLVKDESIATMKEIT